MACLGRRCYLMPQSDECREQGPMTSRTRARKDESACTLLHTANCRRSECRKRGVIGIKIVCSDPRVGACTRASMSAEDFSPGGGGLRRRERAAPSVVEGSLRLGLDQPGRDGERDMTIRRRRLGQADNLPEQKANLGSDCRGLWPEDSGKGRREKAAAGRGGRPRSKGASPLRGVSRERERDTRARARNLYMDGLDAAAIHTPPPPTTTDRHARVSRI